MYEASRFKNGGFAHHELYFPDGSCPTREIRDRFLNLVEDTNGMQASQGSSETREIFSGKFDVDTQVLWQCTAKLGWAELECLFAVI